MFTQWYFSYLKPPSNTGSNTSSPGRSSCPSLGHSPQPLGEQVSVSVQISLFWSSIIKLISDEGRHCWRGSWRRKTSGSNWWARYSPASRFTCAPDFLMSFFNQGFEAVCMGDAFYEGNWRDPRRGDQSSPLDCQAVGSCQLHLLLCPVPHDPCHFPHLHIQVTSQRLPRLNKMILFSWQRPGT